MGDVAVRAEGLGKQYRLGVSRERYHTLRDQVRQWAGAPLRALVRRARRTEARPRFWALKDVGFEVPRGEAVGVIGRNGAGKSTLLKILSRITEPTEGAVDIYGRVGSLLEVGTGFHPELTGRENVSLNGAILGMRRAEIARKFDEIVAFAEVEKFIDTPVKHYSSGMYTRLAFAVAAHLEPEILIVDEVLAVGDAAFQKKCLGKMGEVTLGGRTVLFVSHNMGAIAALCSRGLVLNAGRVEYAGPIGAAIDVYNAAAEVTGTVYTAPEPVATPHFTRIEASQEGVGCPPFRIDRPIRIELAYEPRGVRALTVGMRVRNSQGVTVIHSTDDFLVSDAAARPGFRRCILPAHALAEGSYFVRGGLFVRGGDAFQALDDVISFRVDFAGHMADRTSGNHWYGVCGPGLVRWESE